ncbi:CHAT domain-containing protein [Cylindrospermum sp. FACHB-282]|uniref:CHAT domain-containing protein n=1 Tax=Cylindrospermum sp. FACHB-282 TaxID=2692794 RepID=UPI001686A3ED|nr:CHAT domain-containing protein [Cylindrospermum sp. FACHB-282]MBD2387873.1 CHAT domain-containing protein [Cylindrospermum sp. FACHB-282]
MLINTVTRLSVSNFVKVKRQKAIRLFLYFITALLCILSSPVLASVPRINTSYQLAINNINSSIPESAPASLLQQGKVLYQSGRFAQAVQVLKQAVEEYQQQGDILRLATSLSNLSLAYQQLGAWTEAKQAIENSLKLLKGQDKSQNLPVLAQSLDIQGRLQLTMGQPEVALATWKQTEEIYKQAKNKSGVVRVQINQAQAWRSQGFYNRALEKLKLVNQTLQSQPDSLEKAIGCRALGDMLLLVGKPEESIKALEESLAIAQRLSSPVDIGASLFSLGNHTRTLQQTDQAIKYYQQAVAVSPSRLTKVQAQLNHLSLLIQTQQLVDAQTLFPLIRSQLDQLPPSRSTIYAHINFAESVMKAIAAESKMGNKGSHSVLTTKDLALLLARANQQAQSLGDKQAEAYTLESLGGLYEKTGQITYAQNLTRQGLTLAQFSNAPEIAYRLEWQLGRLLRAQKDFTGAIAAYDVAVETLQSLRSDLVAVNPEVQFNFRDTVEPVYRESVELLLQSLEGKQDEIILEKARERIEALQLAELDNFFREACLQGQKVALDQLVDKDNPTAAILYPIILPQEIQVIVKIPHKPLRNYITKISQADVEKILLQLRKNLVSPSALNDIKIQSQKVYNWLLQPIDLELQARGVKTLVFVLDGPLRNLPMASLYDGKKFLVEKYAIALSMGLQLLNPKPLVPQLLNALTAGLTQPPPEFPKFAPLPAIKSELKLIAQSGVSTTSLVDEKFTRGALERQINATQFNVVHLATHGEFSSRAENTFILTADRPIKVKDFELLLGSQNQTRIELLVLSACQTAAGDNRAALGLAGAAIRAGAHSTVASLWQIDDESTALFVGEFYRQLKGSNMTKAEALRLAQIKLLKHPNYNKPGFWAAYVLIGNWL